MSMSLAQSPEPMYLEVFKKKKKKKEGEFELLGNIKLSSQAISAIDLFSRYHMLYGPRQGYSPKGKTML